MTVKRIANHIARMIELVPWRLRGGRFVAFLRAIGGEVQELEDVVDQSIEERYLSTAEGVQLDQYGDVLGLPRNGLSDDDYRAALEVQIMVNRSSGEPDRLITIAQILLGVPVAYSPIYPAGFRMDYTSPAASPVSSVRQRLAAEAIGKARAAGVGVEGIFEALEPPFGFDDDPEAFPFDEGWYAEDIFARYAGN